MKYLADLAGVNPGLVRKYVAILRSMKRDHEYSGSSGGISE